MLCERCNKKKSTVIYRENLSGRVRVLRLCGECAEILESAGELEEISAAFAGFSSPLFQSEEGCGAIPFLPRAAVSGRKSVTPPAKCPLCLSTLSDIAATGKVGCAQCYDTFGEALQAQLRSVHGKSEHAGRTTAGWRARREKLERLSVLRQNLKDAIVAEQYETAAGLRDEIRAIEAETAHSMG